MRRFCAVLVMMGLLSGAAQAAEVALTWDAPTSGVPPVGYILHYGTAPGVYHLARHVGEALQTVVPGLVPGRAYYFVVKSYTGTQTSDYSNELSVTIPLAPTVTPPAPGVPTLHTVTVTVTVTIAAPAAAATTQKKKK